MSSRGTAGLLIVSCALVFACGAGENATFKGSGNDAGAAIDDASDEGGAIGDDGGVGSPNGDGGAIPPQDAGPPAIRFIGRFDARDAAGPTCGWPGCRIIARFSGTRVSVKLNERVETWMLGGPSEWDVTIDGVLQPQQLVLELGAHDYVLAESLLAGPHRVELYKRSETQNGNTQFLGYDFAGGALLPPPLPASRRIELIGDSAAAGFGIEGVGYGPDCPGPNWAARWQNFHKSFGARLGEIFNADLNATVFSGKGLVRDIWRADVETMPVIYGRANPIDPASEFDLGTFVPDVYLMMLGGNDFALGQPVDNGPATLAEFTQATRNLVARFRATAPQAHVLLVLSPSTTDEQPAGRQSRTNVKTAFDTVASEHGAAGDTRVYSVSPPIADETELTGCNGHGSPAFHERLAQQLAAVVKQKTGW